MGALRNILMASALMMVSIGGFADDSLEFEDIQPTVAKLLEYHVDEKQVNTKILQRSFKGYVDLFDGDKLYFTKADLEDVNSPDPSFLQETLEEFQKGIFENFEFLQVKIRNAIQRARSLREEIYQHYDEYLNTIDKDLKAPEHLEEYPADLGALKERNRYAFVLFLKAQSLLAKEGLKGKKEKVIALYERMLLSKEDDFLADQGLEGFPSKERYLEHYETLYILKAFAKSLDSHTSYFSPQEAYSMRMQLEKGFRGIGVVLQEGLDGIVVRKLVEGGPAADSGKMKDGDVIVAVDGMDVRNTAFDRILDKIRGEEGSIVRLGMVRFEGEGDHLKKVEYEVDLERRMIVMDDQRVDVHQEAYGDGIIGVIKLHAFYEGIDGVTSEKDIKKAIQDLKSQGPLKGLVLDLRNNSGGFLTQAVKVAGLFISNGVVAVSKYGNGYKRYFRDLDGYTAYDGPLVVLTSKASASAAEIVSQTLQDYGRALIVGDERTYGKGSIQHQTVTSDDADLFFKVTVGRYYTASGSSTQITGVLADIVVPSDYHNERIGEEYLEYPLNKDKIASSFQDSLADINPEFRDWFEKYYIPTLEKPDAHWRALIPKLQEKSLARISHIKAFKDLFDGKRPEPSYVANATDQETFEHDIQAQEAIEIVKDMYSMNVEASGYGLANK